MEEGGQQNQTDQYSAAVSMMLTLHALLAIDQDAAGHKFMFQPLRPAQPDSAGSAAPPEGDVSSGAWMIPGCSLALLNSTAESAQLTTRSTTVVGFGPVQLNRV